MADCENLQACIFFNNRMSDMPLVSEILKAEHCLGDWGPCARYRVKKAGRPVPDDLFPDDSARASSLLRR